MKKYKYIIPLFFICLTSRSQNLILNGGFELYSSCPSSISQLDSALHWFNPSTATPDYFNQCATSFGVWIPINAVGYQWAHSGAAYAGMFLYAMGLFSVPDYREYIETTLTTPLTANNCYHFEMYVNLANNVRYTTDDIGIYFSDTLISGIVSDSVLPFTPQINHQAGVYPDSSSWLLVSGDYIANGGEKYILIGNFKDHAHTDTIAVHNNLPAKTVYIYVDDVSLALCTGVEEAFNEQSIAINPNPASNQITLTLKDGSAKNTVYIYDVTGKVQMKEQLNSSLTHQLNISTLTNGIYIVEVRDAKGNAGRKKLVKQ